MNKHHEIALAAAHRWADSQPKPCSEEQAITYGIWFSTVYDAAIWHLENVASKKSFWQKLGFA